MIFLVLINTVIFIMLSFVHIYWTMIGRKDLNAVLPTDGNGKQAKNTVVGNFVIAALLGIFTFITIGNLNIYDAFIDHSIIKYATIVIGILFILRAIGNFTSVGFFKKQNGTTFAIKDTRYYSPLCVFLGASSIAIALLH